MQSKLVRLFAKLDDDGNITEIKLKSIDESPKSLPRPSVSFSCLCCNEQYAITVELKEEQAAKGKEEEKPSIRVVELVEIIPELPVLDDIKKEEEGSCSDSFEPFAVPDFEPSDIPDESQLPKANESEPKPPPKAKAKRLECPECLIVFKDKHSFRGHQKKHQKYICEYCSASFNGKWRLLSHFAGHGYGLACTEPGCHGIYPTRPALRRHLQSHSGQRMSCDLCAFQTAYRGSMVRHMAAHQGQVEEGICDLCGKRITEKRNLKAHIARVHGVREANPNYSMRKTAKQKFYDETGTFECKKCSRRFATKIALNQHIYYAHPGVKKEGDAKYACEMCGITYRWKRDLKTHKDRIHEREMHNCPMCPSKYHSYSNMMRHVNAIHTKKRVYECEICKKIFNQSSARNNHRRIHFADEKHECPYCLKRITDSGSFSRHKKQHRENGDPILKQE